jgi:ABC-type uncharacterized transport system permease subunit
MNGLALTLAFVAYTLTAGLQFARLFTERSGLQRAAQISLGVGLFAHAAYIFARFQSLGLSPLADVHEALSSFSWLLAAGYAAFRLFQPKLEAAGLFIAPLTALLLGISAVTARQEPLALGLGKTLLPLHIGAALLAIVALGLASAVAIMYLLLERRLKQKRFGAIYQQFPSLEVLDKVSFRSVAVGFPLFTLAILAGVFTARDALSALLLQGNQILQYSIGVLGWIVFGVMLQARLLAGWRGRRAAVLTIAGFLCALAVLLLYLVR